MTVEDRNNQDIDAHVESAIEKLEDDDLVAFQLVAIRRDGDDGHQDVSQRAVDMEAVMELPEGSRRPYVSMLHRSMCRVYESDVMGDPP